MSYLPGVGSQTIPVQLQRAGTDLRRELARLGVELASGRAAEPSERLRGDLGALAAVEGRLQRIEAQEPVLANRTVRVAAVQTGLEHVTSLHETLREATLSTLAAGATEPELRRLAEIGEATLHDALSVLGRSVAGEFIFAGNRTDRPPLPNAAEVLAAARAALTGAADAAEVRARLSDFFHNPSGGFMTLLYAGGAPVPHDPTDQAGAQALPTAADPALRAVLEGAVLAALVGDDEAWPSPALRRNLAEAALSVQVNAHEGLVSLRARVGVIEAALADRRVRLSAERDAMERARHDLIGTDPYTTASRLEAYRAQLEALYAVTARIAHLSLVNYLR